MPFSVCMMISMEQHENDGALEEKKFARKKEEKHLCIFTTHVALPAPKHSPEN